MDIEELIEQKPILEEKLKATRGNSQIISFRCFETNIFSDIFVRPTRGIREQRARK